MADAIGADLSFLHRLEECRLGLGRRTVDLVGEHDVREERAGLKDETLGRPLEDADADEVRREQVGGELDALPAAVDRRGESLRKAGLAHTGHILDEKVTLRE